MTIPSGLAIDTAKIDSVKKNTIGTYASMTTSGTPAAFAGSSNMGFMTSDPSDTDEVFFSKQGVSSTMQNTDSDNVSTTSWSMSVLVTDLPISGWNG
ncbi:MAG: hypothetical protein EBS55_08560 [Flavobacteriaceae bacterium]|nr:hypothetical protein [Flavobacteriaceae bacterium]